MILTRDMVDAGCPTHNRTSCSDENPVNGAASVGKLNVSGVPETKWPRCTRCYLLSKIGESADSLEFSLVLELEPKRIPKKEKEP